MTAEQHEWHDDRPDEWSEQISAAHPLRSGNHEAYATAMQMVGNRRSKAALVELVCWLLQQNEQKWHEGYEAGLRDSEQAFLMALVKELRGTQKDKAWSRDNEATRYMLLLANISVPIEEIQGWSDETVKAGEEWATAVHLSASDNDVSVPSMPEVLSPFCHEE